VSKHDEVVATGVLHGGHVDLDDARGFAEALQVLGEGSIVVRVDRVGEKARRSVKANRYYWGVVLTLIVTAAEGNTKDDIHDAMCDRFLKRTIVLVNKHTGEVTEHEVARRSSTLTPEEFTRFVEEVRVFGSEFFGLTIPDPDPFWRDHDATYQFERAQ